MEMSDTLTTLYRHNVWANLQLLDLCAGLSDDQLQATVSGTFGTIADTWRHIMHAERSYLARISTGQPYRRPADAPPPTPEELRASLEASGNGLIEWSQRVQPDATVEINWDGTPRLVPKTIILAQAINHATEHRAHIMTILTQLGIAPPELDCWSYFDATDR